MGRISELILGLLAHNGPLPVSDLVTRSLVRSGASPQEVIETLVYLLDHGDIRTENDEEFRRLLSQLSEIVETDATRSSVRSERDTKVSLYRQLNRNSGYDAIAVSTSSSGFRRATAR
jgi:hypothetical protein